MPYADPSIILGAQPLELPDRQNMLLKALQVQGLQGQNQLQGLQINSAQQSAEETNRLRQLFSDPTTGSLDPNALRAKIMGAAPIAGQPILKSMLDTQKTQGEIQGTSLSNAEKGRTAVGSLAGSLAMTKPDLGPQDITMFAQQAAKLGVNIDPQEFATTRNPDGSFNVDAARKVLLGYKTQGMSPEQQFQATKPQFFATEQGIAGVQPTIDGSQPSGYMVGNVQGAATSRNGQPGVGPGIPQQQSAPPTMPGDQWETLLRASFDPNPAVSQPAKARLASMGTPVGDPATGGVQTAGATIGRPQVSQGQPQPQATSQPLGAKPSGTWELDPLTGQRVYAPKFATPGDTLGGGTFKPTAADQALIDQIGKYQIAPPNANAIRNPHEAAILSEVARQYPTFDATEFPARQKALRDFSTGVQGNALRSVSVASDHLDQLAQAGDALKNGNYQLVNKVANAFGTQTGDSAQTSFNAIKQIVGDEVLKAVIGGGAGGVSDRAELAAQLKDASSPKQLADVITQYRHLMAAQKDALVAQYENTTGRTDAATRFNFGKKNVPASANGAKFLGFE